MSEKKEIQQKVNIIGSGLAGLSAAIELAKNGICSILVSLLPSERSQSVMAEGGINGALNTMGEADCPEYHFADTMRAGMNIADPAAVKGLTFNAPQILLELKRLGVPFNLKSEEIQQRNFGGQKKKRTAYAKSSTGKVLMTALIDESRKYEAEGKITRYSSHEFIKLLIDEQETCRGVVIRNKYSDERLILYGPVILATGGLNGFFPEKTTGTVTNTGDAAAAVFSQGVLFSNLEMIQYHPTTIEIAGKRCLISEAARGEGGRLYIERNGRPWYFMEDLFPEYGNLMPRDVVSRQMYFVSKQYHSPVFLDMRHLTKEIWEKKLPDLRKEVIHYLGIDPAREPVLVEPGIHYFMGGIDVDVHHQTNIRNLYASGECCSQYHGANRLGGNSTLAAIYGGKKAAETIIQNYEKVINENAVPEMKNENSLTDTDAASMEFVYYLRDILMGGLGIVREEKSMTAALDKIEQLKKTNLFCGKKLKTTEKNRLLLAEAMIKSALFRKESRGAHYRSDFPDLKSEFQGLVTSKVGINGEIQNSLRKFENENDEICI